MAIGKSAKIILSALLPLLAAASSSMAATIRPLPDYVVQVAGKTPAPAYRPWNLPPEAGPNASIDPPDALGELKPYPLPEGSAGDPAKDPAAEYLAQGLEALRSKDQDKAAYAFTTGMRSPVATSASDACAFWLGEIRWQKGFKEEAAAAYAKVRGELKAEALYRLTRLTEGVRPVEVVRKSWRTVAEDPASSHRGEAYYRLGELEMDGAIATGHLTLALKFSNSGSDVAASANYRLAVALRSEGKLRDAERALSLLLLSRPDHPVAQPARVLKGWIELETGHREEAARALGAAEKEPGLTEPLKMRVLYALCLLATTGDDTGEYSRTLAALALDSQGPWAGWACAFRAASMLEKGRRAEALDAYHESLVLWRLQGLDALRFATAQLHFEQGEYREAAKLFLLVDSAYVGAPEAERRAAEALALAGDHSGAALAGARLLEDHPDFEERDAVRIALAGELMELGRNDEAERVLEAVPSETPGREPLLYLKALRAQEEGRNFEAEELLTLYEAKAQVGRLGHSLLLHAKVLKGLGFPADAAEKYLKAASIEGNPEKSGEARLEAGKLLLTVGDGERGAQELTRLLAELPAGPQAPRAHMALAEYRHSKGQFEEAARRYHDASLSTDTGLALAASRGEGASLLALKKYEEALAVFVKLGDDPDALASSAVTLAKLGRVEEMASVVGRFEALQPGSRLTGELLLKLADARMVEGRSDEAAADYEKAAALLDPADRDRTLLLKGIALEGSGRPEEAAALYENLGTGAADPGLRVAAKRRLAMIDLSRGKPKEAAERLKALLPEVQRGGEEEAGLLNDLAEAFLGADDLAAGYETLRRASALGEGEEKLKTDFLLGEFLEKSGKVNAALETYQRIAYHYDLVLTPAATAALRAASLLVSAGRPGEAAELYLLTVKGAKSSFARRAAQELKALKKSSGQ